MSLRVMKSACSAPDHLKNGKLEFITPAIATKLLAMVDRNLQRKLKPHLVDKYVRQMKDGFWLPVPSNILITDTGKTIDGQHRLHAIMQSGIGQWMHVFKNCPESIRIGIDIGGTRTYGDTLPRDIAYSGAVSAALTLLYQYERGLTPGSASTITSGEKEELRQRHPLFSDSVNYVMRKVNLGACTAEVRRRRSILILCHYLGKTRYPGYADDYIHKIATGDGVVIGSPVYLVRSKMASYGNRQSLNAKDINILTAQMFNTFVAMEPAPKKIRPDRDLPEFPSIVGASKFGYRTLPAKTLAAVA